MADRYWNPAANALWADANVWATTDGGDPTGVATPTSSDDVYFTSTNVRNCAINATANCKNLTFTGGTGYTGVLTGSGAINIYGSFAAGAGMTWTYYQPITYKATTTGKTLTFNGKAVINQSIFDGAGGEWIVQDNWSCGTITLTNGSLNTNGKTLTVGSGSFLISSNSNTRVLTLGNSTLTFENFGDDSAWGTNFTLNADTSTLNLTGRLYGVDGLTWNIVAISVASGNSLSCKGAMTFSTLTVTGDTNKANNFAFYANQTITGTLTLNGNSKTNRLLVKAGTKGTAITLTAGTVASNGADFQDITGAGAGSWDLSGVSNFSGDCGGNTNITFTTADDCYWVHGASASYNWSASQWAHESGGTVDQRVPLSQDTAIFDAGSFAADGKTVVQDMARVGSVTFADTDQAFTFTPSTACSVFGSMTLDSNLTFGAGTQVYTFEGRGNFTLDCAGKTWEKNLTINNVSGVGTLNLINDCTLGVTRILSVTSGTFTCVDGASNYVISSGKIQIYGGTLTLGSATHLITGVEGYIWYRKAGTVTSGTYTLKFTGALTGECYFYGGSISYNNYWNATTNNYAMRIVGSNTFNDFKIDAGRTVKFTAATTTTVTTFTAIGTGVAGITITSVTAANHNLSCATGTISVEYCTISRSQAAGGATWEAFTDNGNVDGGNNSGWLFAEPSTATGNFFLVF